MVLGFRYLMLRSPRTCDHTHTCLKVANNLPILPWWDSGEDTPAGMLAAIDVAKQQLASSRDVMRTFTKRSLLVFVFMANKLERTVPAGVDEFTSYRLLEQQLDSPQDSMVAELGSSPALEHRWPAEGGPCSLSTGRQLLQFLKAVQYQCWPLRPLTVDSLCTAHKLMMWGAVEDGVLLAAGEFRTTPAHSGTGYVYPEADTIPQRLPRIIDDFTSSLNCGTQPSYRLAAELLYRFVTLHPFQNGNGRMCRLLAGYALLAAGAPFMLHLSNGRSKTRQHYQQALQHADKAQGSSTLRLQSYILECMHLQWQNAVAYAGLQ